MFIFTGQRFRQIVFGNSIPSSREQAKTEKCGTEKYEWKSYYFSVQHFSVDGGI